MTTRGINISAFDYVIRGKKLFTVKNAMLKPGELVALLGINGSGKTSFIKCLLNISTDYSGIISIDGLNCRSLPPSELAQKVAVLFTGRQGIPGSFQVKTLIATGRYPYSPRFGFGNEDDEKIVLDCAERMDVSQFLFRQIDSLSDGEFQKVMLARALAQNTPYILLDEPFSFLDYPAKLDLLSKLRTLAMEGKGILFSSHELELIFPHISNAWLLCRSQDGISELKTFDNNALELADQLKSEFGYRAI